jgi:hypothetical protein
MAGKSAGVTSAQAGTQNRALAQAVASIEGFIAILMELGARRQREVGKHGEKMFVSACPYARIIWIRFIGFSLFEKSQAFGHPEAMSV